MTQNELVIAQLMDGDALTSKEIAEKISGNGVRLDEKKIATLMNKLCKTDLGHFIKKKRKDRAFEYQIVDEARHLTPEEAYGLSLKIGKNRYPLEQALEDHPDLKKHVKATRKKKAAEGKTGTRAAVAGRKSKAAAEKRGEALSIDAEGLQSALMGLLKMVAADGNINVKVDVTVRFEK